MADTISPNMSLVIPTVGSEAGPTYAFDVNASLTIIDGHDHTSGSGKPIRAAALAIDGSVAFNDNPAISLQYMAMTAQNAATAALQALSSAPASAVNELWYTDSNGVATQITSNGTVLAPAASIPGESYVAGTFIWVQGGGSTTPANFDIGSVVLRPNTAGTTNGVTLSPPGAIASAYTINLPALPASTCFLQMTSTGVMSASIPLAAGLTGSNIAAATLTGSNIAALTITGGNIAAATITDSNMVANTLTAASIALSTIIPNNLTAINSVTAGAISGSLTNSTATCSVSGYATANTTNRVTSWNFSGYLNVPSNGVSSTTITITIHQGLATSSVNTVVVSPSPSGTNQMIPMSAFNCTLPTGNVGAAHTTDVNIAVSGALTVSYTNVAFTAVWG